MREILIAGGGPAGAAAAVSARLEGSPVRLLDRARTPRHKVCGEFISPGAAECLHALHLWGDFAALSPARIRRCKLHLGNRTKLWTLAQPAWGLSRFQLDELLLRKASALGAIVTRGESFVAAGNTPVILAYGRNRASAGDRLFGFKAHFEGPCDDAVELFFDREGYVGVGGIEGGLTNVCGLARESALSRYDFNFDDFVRRSPVLAERLQPLSRRMRWIAAGPLAFSTPACASGAYPAGDALGFVDPFTGSGILNALFTGRLAGQAAARGVPPAEYRRACRSALERPFRFASALRYFAARREFHPLAHCIPGSLLFRMTRVGQLSHLLNS